MNNLIQEKLTLFIENYQAIKGDFIWHDNMAKRLAALCYAMEGKQVNIESIRESHNLMKEELSVFSGFRGNLAIYIAASLSLRDDPSQLLTDTLHVHDLLKDAKFWSGDYLSATAFEIAISAGKTDYNQIVTRTREFYDEMKSYHRFHIGQDDYIFMAMMALSNLNVHDSALKANQLFRELKRELSSFISSGNVLHLAQMLVLGESTEACVDNMLRLNKVLRKRKVRLDKTYIAPSLGVLGLLPVDHYTLAEDLINARDYLRAQKGFGAFSVSIQELMLYAVSSIIYAYARDKDNIARAGAVTSVTNLIIAQQVAMMVAIATATSAAAASGGC